MANPEREARLRELVLAFAREAARTVEDTFGASLVSLALFGSAARNALRKGSDLDLLVVLEDPPRSYGKRVDRVVPLMASLRETGAYRDLEALELDLEPSFLILSRDEVADHPPILLDMVDDAVLLADKEGFLRGELEVVRARLRELGSVKKRLPDGSWYWVLKPDFRPGEVIRI